MVKRPDLCKHTTRLPGDFRAGNSIPPGHGRELEITTKAVILWFSEVCLLSIIIWKTFLRFCFGDKFINT